MTSKQFMDSLDPKTRATFVKIADEVTVAANKVVKGQEEAKS
jgi:hypothetical protein